MKETPPVDPIIEEIHKVREEYATQFDYDLDAIVCDLERMEQEDGGYPASKPPADSVVEEMRRYGNEYAARFDYDLERMVQDLRRRQEESGRKVVSFSRENASPTATNPPTAPARPSKRRGT